MNKLKTGTLSTFQKIKNSFSKLISKKDSSTESENNNNDVKIEEAVKVIDNNKNVKNNQKYKSKIVI